MFTRLGVHLGRTKPSKTYPEGQEHPTSAELEPIAAGDGPGAELATAILDYRHHATALYLLLEPMDVLALAVTAGCTRRSTQSRLKPAG